MSTLRRYKQSLEKWGLKENPFRTTPPESFEQLAQIFYGRKKDIEIALPALYEGRNVLVRGAWGIGKTALMQNLLYQLQQEVAELEEKMLVLYLGSVPGETANDFYRALVLAVADSLAEIDNIDPKIIDIANTMLGYSIQKSKTNKEGKVQLGFLSFSNRKESPRDELTPTSEIDAYSLLIPLLDEAEKHFSRLVVAIDDLDKKDPSVVQDILEGSLDLFRRGERRAFVITGRGLTDLQEATLKALGIFSEDIALTPMSQKALSQIVINYLNTVREKPQNNFHPFTEEVIALITEYAQGIPRQLNNICEKVLRQAALEEHAIINTTIFDSVWQTLQKEFTFSLTPHIRRLLYVAYEAQGINEDIDDQYLEKLGVLTFVELLPKLKPLEEQELLIRQEDETGYRFVPSKLYSPQLPSAEPE